MREAKTNATEFIKLYENGLTVTELAKHFGYSKANISKRLKRLIPPPMPESLNTLTKKEQAFVLAKAGGKTQTEAALEAFDCNSRDSAKALGYNLMMKPDIERAVAEVMQEVGLTKAYRVQKLKKHVDSNSADVSLKALDQSWKLDGAYTEKYVHVDMSYKDLAKRARDLDAQIKENKRLLGEMDDDESQVVEGEVIPEP